MEPVLGFLEDDSNNYEEYDDTKLPTTGLEYLRRVQQEAEQCPEIVTADMRGKKFTKKQTHIKEVSGCTPAPVGTSPSLEWQQQQAAEFADIRQTLANYRAKRSKLRSQYPMPFKNQETGWCRFCLGRETALKMCKENGYSTAGLTKPSYKEPTDDDEESHGPDIWEYGTPPLLTMMIQLNQTMVQRLLEYHIQWMTVLGYSHAQGRWLHALLACLEKPLLADCTAHIRTLARQCATCRASQLPVTNENAELVMSLNLIIALVARYFGQTDLADPG